MSDTITIDTDASFELPLVEILTGRGFVTGKSGTGKSNTISVIAEELLDEGFPFLIVDTDGEYWSLKEEYEVLHVGDDESCELQVGPEHADALAKLALEDHIPIILDISGYIDADVRDAVVRDTCQALFDREKHEQRPFPIFVEEVHEYIPQQGGLGEVGQVLVRIAKRGRKRGLGLVGVSQRPASVDKEHITQCDWLVWHRLTWDSDTDVVKSVVGPDAAKDVAELADGQAIFQADFIDEHAITIQVRRKHTFDAGATPDLDSVERPELKSVSDDLVEELQSITEQESKRRDRVEYLESKLDERDERIDQLEGALDDARNMQEWAQQFTQAMQAAADPSEAVDEQLDELIEERNRLQRELSTRGERIEELQSRVAELEEYEERVERTEHLDLDAAEEAMVRLAEATGIAVDGGDEKLRSRIDQLNERIDDLEAENERLRERREQVEMEGLDTIEQYDQFLDQPEVQEAIDEAKQVSRTSPRYVQYTLGAIIDNGGWTDYDDITQRLDVSDNTHVSKAASVLENRGIIRKKKIDGRVHVDLNVDGLNEIRAAAEKRRRTEELVEKL